MFYFPVYKHPIQHPKQACLLWMISFSDHAPTSCYFSLRSAPIGLVNFLLLIFMPIPHCGFLSLLALPLFSVFALLFFILPFFPSLLFSLPFIYPHIFDVQISSCPIQYPVFHEAVSCISWDYLTPFDFCCCCCFQPLSLFPICGKWPWARASERSATYVNGSFLLSSTPSILLPFTKNLTKGVNIWWFATCSHTGVWVSGAMNLGHEQQAAVALVAWTHWPSECILSFGCHVPWSQELGSEPII